MKHHLLLATAGHIDHGKTALVKALTGVDTDRLPDEKRRQITIDLGFASLELDDYLVGIVDVPGHERFVKNMLAGATAVDLAMLVVAVDDSIKPQTREHLGILEYLRLQAGVVVLTKCDVADADWIELVESEVRDSLAGTFLESAPLVRVSAKTGEGIDALRAAIAQAAAIAVEHRAATDNAPFRMAIDRVFTVRGHGTVVTGGIASGQVCIGDELELLPQRTTVRVRGLQNHDAPANQLGRGQRGAINVTGVHYQEVTRGQTVASPGTLKTNRLVSVALRLSDQAPRPLKHRAQVRFHVGTSEMLARVLLLGRSSLAPGEETFAQLLFTDELAIAWGQPFVIRVVSPMATLGGGRVLDGAALRIKRFTDIHAQQLTHWTDDDPHRRAEAAAFFAGVRRWDPANLYNLAGVVDGKAIVDDLVTEGVVRRLPVERSEAILLHRDVLVDVIARLEQVLQIEHGKTPLRTYVERSRLDSHFGNLDSSLLDALLRSLVESGEVVTHARGLRLARWQAALSDTQTDLLRQIVELFCTAEIQPPSVAEVSQQLGERLEAVAPLIDVAEEQRLLVRMAAEIYLHPDTEKQAKQCLSNKMIDGAALTVGEIREALGTSRKFAVPLCEYFDKIGFTRRDGNLRYLVRDISKVIRK